mmetsp:Transcript_54995/g.130537  ORF Transcript_54995/g.130537 Transcript_54995/m.130537 type:complete len:367 (-) Transcript_54995:97-1197(-)
MREGGGGRGVGKIVGRHVDGLDGGDGALLVGGNALLQETQIRGERRLVPDSGGDAPEQRRHLGVSLGEAEDVVDEEEHVLALLVAEVLRHGETGERDAGAGARRLVHLAVHERALALVGVELDHAPLDHLVVEVVALARALADTGEHGVASVALGDVVDQLHDEHGLADAGAAEEADLAALGVGREQVHDLDARDEDLGLSLLVGERGRVGVDGHGGGRALGAADGAALVDGLADDVDDAPEELGAGRHHDGGAHVDHLLPAGEALRGVHGNAAHGVLAEMLGNLEHDPDGVILDLERVEDGGELVRELHVNDGADNLLDLADRAASGARGVNGAGHEALRGHGDTALRHRGDAARHGEARGRHGE